MQSRALLERARLDQVQNKIRSILPLSLFNFFLEYNSREDIITVIGSSKKKSRKSLPIFNQCQWTAGIAFS
jgi:hypothetical protein